MFFEMVEETVGQIDNINEESFSKKRALVNIHGKFAIKQQYRVLNLFGSFKFCSFDFDYYVSENKIVS